MSASLPTAPLRLAALQTEAVPGDVADNALRAAELVSRATRLGARVAVLPELYLTAYDLPTIAGAPETCQIAADAAGHITDARLRALATAASEGAAVVLVGAAVRRPDGTLTNSVLAADPTGRITVVYDKQNLWHADEARLFTPGSRGGCVEVDGWRLGIGVCYDMSFPEHARAAAAAGAHAYVCLSAFATGNEHRAAVYLAARALENTVYTVFVNPVGGPADRPANGGSAIYGPDGSTLDRATAPRTATLMAELHPSAIAHVRGFLHMLAEYQTQHPSPAVRGAGAAHTVLSIL
ncbi:carbon-nitrogen hydrolase family protein [Streptomyces sp. NPDC002886]|uniref:carbon-nitrogen hydrolase family protein n=1 Tax=Streptomyces sp. NPDC002886 TaxID=3364667 RepID=UPI0036875B48